MNSDLAIRHFPFHGTSMGMLSSNNGEKHPGRLRLAASAGKSPRNGARNPWPGLTQRVINNVV